MKRGRGGKRRHRENVKRCEGEKGMVMIFDL